MVVGLYVVIKI